VAAEEAEGGEAGSQEDQYRQKTISSKKQGAEADQGLQEAVAGRHFPVSDGHFVCQELVDVPSVGLEADALLQPAFCT